MCVLKGGRHMKRPSTSKHAILVLSICSLLAASLLISGTQSAALSGMLEATLNLLWLSVALAAFGCFRSQRRALSAAARRRFGRLYGRLALGCALVLLFPVLSITDELHAQPAVMAGSSRVARKLQKAVPGKQDCGNHAAVPAATRPENPVCSPISFLGKIVPQQTRLRLPVVRQTSRDRAPPLAAIS